MWPVFLFLGELTSSLQPFSLLQWWMAKVRLSPASLVFFLRIPEACSSVVGDGCQELCGFVEIGLLLPALSQGWRGDIVLRQCPRCVPPKWEIRLMPTVLIPRSPLYSHCQGISVDFTFLIWKPELPSPQILFRLIISRTLSRIPLTYLKYVKECKEDDRSLEEWGVLR